MRLVLLALLLIAPYAISADSATTNNLAYYKVLLGIFTNLAINLAFLFSLILLCVSGILYAVKVFSPDSIAKRDLKPMSFISFIGSICLAAMFFAPLNTIEAFNDLSGLVNSQYGLKLCTVVDINVKHFDWENDASACIKSAEDSFSNLAKYSNSEHITSANIGLIYGLVQLIALGFFIGAGIVLAKHMWGSRSVKTSVGGALFAMFISSVIFAAMNIPAIISDLRGDANIVIKTGTK